MYKCIKRIFDFTSALLLFIVILPFFCIIALLTRILNGKPVFFRQQRTGLNMKKFYMLKFRTMTDTYDEEGNLLPDEQRLTKWGKFLRTTSLDELPELINIIRGDMSVVGPRPLPVKYDSYYSEEELKRFNVRGGLIPPCGSLEKNAIVTWDKQFEYEAWYADSVSLKLDLKIMFAVFRILFQRNEGGYGSYVREPLDVERSKTVNIQG